MPVYQCIIINSLSGFIYLSPIFIRTNAQTNFLIWTLSNEYPRQEVFTIMKKIKKVPFPKKKFLYNYARVFQLRMIFTDFLHMFTFLKLEIRLVKKFFGKSYFFPKISNFAVSVYP